MKNSFLIISFAVVVVIAFLLILGLGIPLPAKKYTYTGPRALELTDLSTNSSLPKKQEKLEEVLDGVYIADMMTWKTLTDKYYRDNSMLPWKTPLDPQLIQAVEEITILRSVGGVSDDLFQEILKRDVYLSDDGKNVYWCADLLKNSDRELWEGKKCKSSTKCYCEVFERNI